MKDELKVAVTITVTVDRAAYAEAYGPASAADIREHVRAGVVSAAQHPGIVASEGVILRAEER